VGEKFRTRALRFPALVSGATMVWFRRWPREALRVVAEHMLRSFDVACSAETKQSVVGVMADIQLSVEQSCTDYFQRFRRLTHVTPASYLAFVAGYKTMYAAKHEEIKSQAGRLSVGLHKLGDASECVAQLSVELVDKEAELKLASANADKVLKEVAVTAQEAEKVKSQVQVVKDRAQAIVESIQKDKLVAEAKLAAAKPALEEAEAALNTIKPAHIATVRKLAKPPQLIMRIMDCVLLLFQRKLNPVTIDSSLNSLKPSWSESLKLMSQSGFLQALQNFSKDSINDETVELLLPYQLAPDYNMENAQRVCGDIAGLCSWTCAMAFFHAINKEVLPLKANLAEQEVRLQTALQDLAEAESRLQEKQSELDAAQAMYESAVCRKQTLVDDANTCRRKMATASALIEGLVDERQRWTEQEKLFLQQIDRLVGDSLVATAFLCYCGPFNQSFRSQLLGCWQTELETLDIPFTHDLQVTAMLVSSSTVAEWNTQGLPSDELSIQNGIISTKASRYPLLIDPQGQGKAWLKNREAQSSLQVSHLNHKYFRQHLEDCLSLGKPLLIEDVGEELDPVLDNILVKNFIKSGSTYKVKVGDKEVDVMTGFSLFLTTKLGNPAFSPEVSAKTAVVDFTVSTEGLGNQLLNLVILTEKSELESERVKLIEDVAANKRKIQELEDSLLFRLTNTTGHLVDDEGLVDVLATTKTTALAVKQKLATAAETEAKITAAREEYRPVATRGALVYFLIVDMAAVNVMYQVALREFLGLFDEAIARAEPSAVTSRRVAAIVASVTRHVFRRVVRGFYERHRLLFTLLLALTVDLRAGKISQQDLLTLIKGGAALDIKAVEPKPFKWILDMTWLNLIQLSSLKPFSQILAHVSSSERQWKQWFDSSSPETAVIPDGYHNSLDTLHRLMLVRAWCPDRTVAQARNYITESLGEEYIDSTILDLEQVLAESSVHTPLLCLLSMGADPSGIIEALAKSHKLECRAVSMGQGQEVHARRLMAISMQSGGWVLLQNCHLGLNFCDEVMDIMLASREVDPTFRLWITTEVHPQFPIGLLQMSIKFTNEPPMGVKAGLKRTYAGLTQDKLDVHAVPQWRPLLYAVAFLHSALQGATEFGALGWNVPYEFNVADYGATVQCVQDHLDDVDAKKRGSLRRPRVHRRPPTSVCSPPFAAAWFPPTPFCSRPGVPFPRPTYGVPRLATVAQYQSSVAKQTLDTILSIQPKDVSDSSGETRESVVYRIAQDMFDKLPPDYVSHEVKARIRSQGALSSLNVFLRQEIERMQHVLAVVRATLADLRLAIDGSIVMTDALADTLTCLYDSIVPHGWAKVSWQSSTLGFWFTELLERDAQFRSWCYVGRPSCFWMTGFFNPQGFLTAMRQEVTRAHKGWSLDTVALQSTVTRHALEDVAAAPEEGVYVHGLFLEGAGWDRRGCKLAESRPKVLYEPLPVMHLYAAASGGAAAATMTRFYECPIYKKPTRTDATYVASVKLRTTQPPDHWVLRGTALLCDIT
ncbi:PREDICTED: LOW QUALITY PROTEIN: dynein heavy chain 5, axonemal-like, partial [Priapulus caudatus]|uniref:LOW QUALITY PROTEIN: dynein heavy chain 5, axonemal-like n=1 Tax=Priapulus caudatus TaxID=37621 RepID=A0ABM1F2W6_PRICU